MGTSIYDDQDTEAIKGLEESFHGPSAAESGSQKLADADRLQKQENDAPDDTVGNGYKSSNKKVKVSKGWWNKKRAGIAGSILGIGGVSGILLGGLATGPLEALHISQNLQHAFSKTQSDTENRDDHLLRYIKAVRTGDVHYTRAGIIGSTIVNRTYKALEKNGVKFGSDYDLQGRPRSVTIDRKVINEKFPETKDMTDTQFRKWLGDKFGISATSFTGNNAVGIKSDSFKANIAGANHKTISNLTKTANLELVGDGKVIAGIKGRSLKVWWGMDGLFHPFSNSLKNKAAALEESIRKKNPERTESQARQEAYSQAMAGTVDDAIDSSTPTKKGSEAKDELSSDAKKRNIVNKAGMGVMGIWTTGCLLRDGGTAWIDMNRGLTAVPSAVAALHFISDAEAIKAGSSSDVDLNQIGADLNRLNSDGDFSSAAPFVALSGGTVQKDADGNVINDIPPDYAQAFSSHTTASNLIAAGNSILKYSGLNFAGMINPFGGTCSLTTGIGLALAADFGQIAVDTVASALSCEVGCEGGVASQVAINRAAAAITNQVEGLVISQTIGKKVFATIESMALNKVATPKVALSIIKGPVGGALLAYGAREAANSSAMASGGIAVSGSNKQTEVGTVGLAEQQQFQQESTFARVFDAYDGRSLTGRLANSISPSLASNITSLASLIPNIGSSITGSLGSMVSHANADSTTSSWSGDYNWNFPQYGVPDSVLNDPDLADPYSNMNWVGNYLNNVCKDGSTIGADKGGCADDSGITKRIETCFGNTLSYGDGLWDVSPTPNTDVNPYSANYEEANCGNVSDKSWERIVMFVNDANDVKAMDCAIGDTDTSAQSCEDEGADTGNTTDTTVSPTTSANGTLVVGEYNILNAPSYAHNGIRQANPSDDTRAKLETQIIQGTVGPKHAAFDVLMTNEETNSMYAAQQKYMTPTYGSVRRNEYAIFWNASKFTKLDHGTSTQWTGGGGWVDAPWVKLQTKDGQVVTLTAVHYSSGRDGKYNYSDANITKAANYTLSWAQKQDDGKSIVIFGGDLGDHKPIPAKIFNNSGLVNNSYYMASNKKARGTDVAPGGSDQIYITPRTGLTASDWHNPDRTGIIMTASDHSPTWVTLHYGSSSQ